MKQESIGQTPWIDIIAPTPPGSETSLWWWAGLCIIVIATTIALYFWQQQPRQIARRRMKKLARQLRTEPADQVDGKQLLKQLEHLLCDRFAVPHLSQALLQDSQWSRFREQLVQACYQSQAPGRQQVQQLLSEARVFINRSANI